MDLCVASYLYPQETGIYVKPVAHVNAPLYRLKEEQIQVCWIAFALQHMDSEIVNQLNYKPKQIKMHLKSLHYIDYIEIWCTANFQKQ